MINHRMDRLPIEVLSRQINDDYYKYHMSLNEVRIKYRYYTNEELKKELQIYDLSEEPVPTKADQLMPQYLRREWNAVCRVLNPKAWEKRRR